MQETQFSPSIGKIPWSSRWQPASVFLPGTKLHGQRNLVGYSPWGCKVGPTEHTHTHTVYSQFSSVTQSCPSLCDPMDCSTSGFPVHHQLPELAQTHVHQVRMPSSRLILSHPLLLPPIFPSIRIFSSESVLHTKWPKYWSFSFSISPSNLSNFRTWILSPSPANNVQILWPESVVSLSILGNWQ